MRRSPISPIVALTSLLSLVPTTFAERMLTTTSLNTCQDNSQLTASLFNVVFTPDTQTASFNVLGTSTITGNVTLAVDIRAYGVSVIKKNFNPCDFSGLSGLCPMTNGQLKLDSNFEGISQDAINQIPSFTYGVPDIDLKVIVQINSTTTPPQALACLEARLSTGLTVNLLGVKWATAAVVGLAVVASAFISGLGHSNTAAHIASYALALFGYFQAIAICGLVAVYLPPLALAWTLDFDWTMGIIQVEFLQRLATWYQKATGGTPTTLLNTLTTTSVSVQKRAIADIVLAARDMVSKRASTSSSVTGAYTVTGINRIAFVNKMEVTNLFLTGLIFFNIFVILTVIAVGLFKGFCELAVKANWLKKDKFQDFRNGYLVVLKGIMFRIILIGFPQMSILCLWEFTQVDSPAEVVLAIFFFFGMAATLGWAAVKVIMIARRSEQMHKNPAYILYSDPNALNKWGFLYVQFRATAYYYIVPVLVYIVIKAMFIGFAQKNGLAQAIGLVIIEAAALIAASVIRPWMDKSTNVVNIAICAMNFVNAIILLLLANPFGMPDVGVSISGAAFFIINAIFSLVLLIIILVVTIISLVKKNPDMRYQPMSDDRASFIKSQTQLTTELDALGATARGGSELKGAYKPGLDLDDDAESWSSGSLRRHEAANTALPPSTANSQTYREPPRSPGPDPSAPFLGGGGNAPPGYQDHPRTAYNGYGGQNRSPAPPPAQHPRTGSAHSNNGPQFRPVNNTPAYNQTSAFRAQNNSSPWQRGAGYDH